MEKSVLRESLEARDIVLDDKKEQKNKLREYNKSYNKSYYAENEAYRNAKKEKMRLYQKKLQEAKKLLSSMNIQL